jgi:mannosyltransferase
MEGQAGSTLNGRQRWILLAIILLAFVLRVYELGRAELWFDEALSAAVAGKGLGDILAYTRGAPFEHPPVYYLALHSWLRLAGTSEFALRFFSLAWGVLFVPLVYRLLAPWGGQRFALLAALIAAISVVSIDHSQNARMYSILPVLGVLSLLCFFRALASRQRRWWVAYLVVVGVGIGVHYFFALMLLVPLTFVLLTNFRDRRAMVSVLLILLSTVLLVAGWAWLSTGFREAFQQILRGEGGGVSSLGLRIKHTVGGLLLEEPAIGHLALGALALAGVLFWPLPPPPRAHPVSLVGSRRFLLIWLLVPWLAALALPYWVQDRHLAYLWPALYALIACGLLALQARGKWLFAAGMILVLATSGYGLWRQNGGIDDEFKFGQMMDFIEDRAAPEDLVVLNQPGMWPYVDHYAQRDLAVVYVPATPNPSSEGEVDQQLSPLAAEASRVWLGPIGAWTADPSSLVEQWLAGHAYQAYKEWFPGSGSVALYFMPEPMESLPIERVDWEGRIRLREAQSSSPTVAPGDAVRLSFAWRAVQPVDSSHLLLLKLVDGQGITWASRRSEPCGGWCPTDTWQPGKVYHDHHALLIPPGTPPGRYRLQMSWYDPVEERELATARGESALDLGVVQVIRAAQSRVGEVPRPVMQHPLRVDFDGQVALLGFDLDQEEIGVGETLALDLQWLALGTPASDYTLRLALSNPSGQVAAHWDLPLATDAFPTSEWQAGDLVWGPHRPVVPGHVAPGRYQLQLMLLDADGQRLEFNGSRSESVLGSAVRREIALEGDSLKLASLEVTDRPHSFDLPVMGHTLGLRLGQDVELLGYDLDTGAAVPGGTIEVTLYWRGKGATDRSYKVFTHLGDGRNPPLAQHDGPPGGGCCPTDTWIEGEVVVDQHVISLPADMPPGNYELLVGMYHESSDQRLPVFDSQGYELKGQQAAIAEVSIISISTPVPAPIGSETLYQVYLPLVELAGER